MTNASSILPYCLHHSETRFCAIFRSKFLSVLFLTLFPTMSTDESESRHEKHEKKTCLTANDQGLMKIHGDKTKQYGDEKEKAC